MGDHLHNSISITKSEAMSMAARKKTFNGKLAASGPKALPKSAYNHITSLSRKRGVGDAAGQVAVFLLKVAALETVRRISRAKCPFVWRGFQALQFMCYPPFNWIQKWAPFKGLIRGMQTLSKPLLVLSVATAFSDQEEHDSESSDGISASPEYSELQYEPSATVSTSDTRICDEVSQNLESDDWLIQLCNELNKQGISLPERINDEELHRYYVAANGDFSCLLSSVKKTIKWRETYRILSVEELETWSDLVFWHKYDVKRRPCLIVRLGIACLNLPSQERPRFAQAVISQVEHGILQLVGPESPEVTVLVDCEGLSPLKIPMQILRSCFSILQEHFPNRLGCLFIIRLPPVVRVLAQTLIQVLKPVTRKKLRIEGEMYRKVLLEYLQTLPSYLGGDCTCTVCLSMVANSLRRPRRKGINRAQEDVDSNDGEDTSSRDMTFLDDTFMSGSCEQVLRTAIIVILMFWILAALIAELYDPESRLYS